MKTLSDHHWQTFWIWITGRNFHKIAQREDMDKRDIKDLCERRLLASFKTPELARNEYRQTRRFIKGAFKSLELYQTFYEHNKKKEK